ACAGSYSVTRTWIAKDSCNNSSTASQTINVQDITAPIIAALPDVSTINCPAIPLFAQASATDECNSAFELTFEDVKTDGACAGSYSVTRTWIAKDSCNNSSTASQTINVQDITAPVIAALPDVSTINCPAMPVFAQASATDECNSAFELTFEDVKTDGACAGSYSVTRTWIAKDSCNNSSTASQTINVQDITAPVIAALPDVSTINCPAMPVFAQASATDECNSAFELTFEDVKTDGACAGSYSVTRTWTAKDGCNNSSTASQTINVQDITAPVITAQASNITVECDGLGNETAMTDWLASNGGATATDTCSNVTWSNNFDILSNDCSAAVTVQFTAKDACGNTSNTSATFNVKDSTAPLAPDAPINLTVACAGEVPPAGSLTATDNCNGTITAQGLDAIAPGNCPNSFIITRTWTFTDACNNSSSTTQIINVIDNVAPVAPVAPANLTVTCPSEVPPANSLTATDNCEDQITVQGEDAITPGNCPNSFIITRTWIFSDACGNTSSTVQTINVIDTMAPVFAELPAPITISCPAKPEFTQASAIDNCGGGFTLTFADVKTLGANSSTFSVVRTWTAIDTCGNISTTTQTINVEDKTAPIAPILSTITEQCSATIIAPIAIDGCVGNVIGTTSDPLTYTSQGTFIIHWTFNDGNGNNFSANQTVIIDDTIAPIIPELADVTGLCSATAPTPTTTDNCSGTITATTNDPLTYNLEGTHSIIWTFNDGNGNTSTAIQKVIVSSSNDTTQGTPGYVKCNSDVDLKINLTELLPQGTPTGGTWSDEINQNSIKNNQYIPNGIEVGDYTLKYVVEVGNCSKTVAVVMTVDNDCVVEPACSFLVHNAFSPNNDNINELFIIENIDQIACFPTNTVTIYNRWGILVFETEQYDNSTKVFRGFSEGRVTIDKSSELPAGTYFYIIKYFDANKGVEEHKEGYLYLTR
ncbi:gliding motility-associated C-terminal domain-containing protein, partial [Flavobacterium psychrotolerans]